MNKPLPATPFRVLIVAKTRMKKGFCIGGIAQNGRSVRLCVPAKKGIPNFNHEYKVGDVWRIEEYKVPHRLIPPHTEDIDVIAATRVRLAKRLVSAIKELMPPRCGGLDCLFDGAVQQTPSGRLVVGHNHVPSYSTTFWRPDRDLRLTVTPAGSFRYVYCGDQGECFFSYVGTAKAKPILPAGILLRLSLARFFKFPNEPEETCYLQVSGWFEEDGNATEPSDNGTDDDPNTPSPTVFAPTLAPLREPVTADLPALLAKYFGFKEFRAYQREIIESVLARHDTLVVMATGAGKSLCYQLPAVALPGLTVVISPLISLMEDQVIKLKQFGISAAALNSHTSHEERYAIRQQIRHHKLKLLYLSPERLSMPDTLDLLQIGNVECLVVDEAHCISEWGHDFRPDYREIVQVRQAIGNIPTLALTATATPDVRSDIINNLQLHNVHAVVAPFNRPNLFLAVQPRHNGPWQVRNFLAQHQGESGIIYCSTRKEVDALAEILCANGVPVLTYHAGLEQVTRTENQRRFLYEDAVVMVATVAFGMGIDKPDIRFVLHYNLPSDPESYYQQIGRAGRDGDRAECLLLHGPDDFSTIEYFISQGDPEHAPEAAARLQHMKTWIKEFTCRRKWLLEYFGESDAPDNCGMCDACTVAEKQQVEGDEDITAYALLYLQCVKEVKQKFGHTRIIRILCGSKDKRLLGDNHHLLKSYGRGKILRRNTWNVLGPQFFRFGIVTTDEFGTVKLTPRGHAVLDGKQKVYGNTRADHSAIIVASNTTVQVGDALLFEKLRNLRRQLADQRDVAPFVIFSDRSLRDMTIQRPQTPAEFLKVYGVGEYKAAQFSESVLKVIQAHESSLESSPLPLSQVDRLIATGVRPAQARRKVAISSLQAGTALDDVSKECEVSAITICRYVYEWYQENGKLPDGIVLPQSQVSNEIREQVFALFHAHGVHALEPISSAMAQGVSHLDLDLLRLEYLQSLTGE